MTKIIAILLCAASSTALAGELQSTPVPPGQLNGTRLLLPEVNGSIDAPDSHFVWKALPPFQRLTNYFVQNPESGEMYNVSCAVNMPILNEEKAVKETMQSRHKSRESAGGTVIGEAHESIESGSHGTLSGFSMSTKTSSGTITELTFLFSTGQHGILITGYPPDGKPSENFKKILASVRYSSAPPPSAAASDAESGNQFLAAWYLILGAVGGALTQLFGRLLFKRSLNWATVAIGIVVGAFICRTVYINLITGLGGAPYHWLLELGGALLPIAIFAFVARMLSSLAREKADAPTPPANS